jgi:Fur family ferric uptake transcriptional regulator
MIVERSLSDILREKGLRATKGRMEVLQLFFEAGRPLVHKQISEMLRLKLDRASVYRILNAFMQAGILHQAYVDGTSRVYELPDKCEGTNCHPHFSCRRCGVTTCLDNLKVNYSGSLAKGFIAEKKKVLIEGLCPKCK